MPRNPSAQATTGPPRAGPRLERMPLSIRPAADADLPTITAIYNDAGVGTTASYDLEPVSLDSRRSWFEQRSAAGFPIVVAELDGRIVGYAAYGPFRDKAGYAYTVEHSVYVTRDARHSGVGHALMADLVARARDRGVHAMVGVLDADNAASIAFHRRLGFAEVARLPQVGRKFGRWLDVVMVQLTLPVPDPD